MDASKVTSGKPKKTGAVYRAILSSAPTIPTSTTAVLTGFDELGYVSEDGVTNSNTPSSEDIKAWGGNTVLTTQSDKTDTFALTLIESLNDNVLKSVYGSANVSTESGETVIKANADDQEECAWVIDMVMKGGTAKRIVIPRGKISEIGDVVYKDNEVVGYPITITCVPDEDGNTHYEYMK